MNGCGQWTLHNDEKNKTILNNEKFMGLDDREELKTGARKILDSAQKRESICIRELY